MREKTGLSQLKFAALLGVSVRTLQEWEQGRRAPSGAARTLLMVAARNPAHSSTWRDRRRYAPSSRFVAHRFAAGFDRANQVAQVRGSIGRVGHGVVGRSTVLAASPVTIRPVLRLSPDQAASQGLLRGAHSGPGDAARPAPTRPVTRSPPRRAGREHAALRRAPRAESRGVVQDQVDGRWQDLEPAEFCRIRRRQCPEDLTSPRSRLGSSCRAVGRLPRRSRR